MASTSPSRSHPLHCSSLPPLFPCSAVSADGNAVISASVSTTADPSDHEKASESIKEKPKIRLKIRLKHQHPSVVVERNGSEPTLISEISSYLPAVIESEPTQPDVEDQNDKIVSSQLRKAAMNKEKKSLRLPSREEIEEDLAEIAALAGVKRLSRPKKRSRNDQKLLDRLFPGFGV